MLKRLVGTNDDYALTIARLVLGVVFFIHGDQLMLARWRGSVPVEMDRLGTGAHAVTSRSL